LLNFSRCLAFHWLEVEDGNENEIGYLKEQQSYYEQNITTYGCQVTTKTTSLSHDPTKIYDFDLCINNNRLGRLL